MLKTIKRAVLSASRSAGVYTLAGGSRWRRQRLAILCYHGVSLADEHEWNPSLYVSSAHLESRLELLRQSRCTVLPLDEAVHRLYAGDLPERSVAITFDDGTYDFYKQAFPLFRAFGYPVTVYLTTYHCDHQLPVFRLICSYMFWKRRGKVFPVPPEVGHAGVFDLRTAAARRAALRLVDAFAESEGLSASGKHDLARAVANAVEVDFDALVASRILHIMNRTEAAELAAAGIDIQLHTHRHRTPLVEELFRREIRDNRVRIREISASWPVHFCYPSGNHRPEFLRWLTDQGVVSATTCRSGLASAADNPLLLPRIIDHANLDSVEFEGWLSGVADLLPRRKIHADPIDQDGRARL